MTGWEALASGPRWTGCASTPLRLVSTMLASPPDWLRVVLVRTVGIEPTLPKGKRILSPQRLPFRHVRYASAGDGRGRRATRL